MAKYYAVRVGRKPGIYENWPACKAQTTGFPGAIFKSFPTKEEAEEFVKGAADTRASSKASSQGTATNSTFQEEGLPEVYAFTDGSFNQVTGVYGFGGFLIVGKEKHILQGNGNDPEMASMRNVAGEILGAQAAIEMAVSLGLPEIHIYYDYAGVEMWATGGWKTNKEGTRAYAKDTRELGQKISIVFHKVKGHSGIEGNEEADRLAKKSVGIEC